MTLMLTCLLQIYLQEGAEEFPEFVQNAASNISHDKINVWPFYIVPKLEKWTSPQRRVIILEDAAHAIPLQRDRV
jgi:hypothetical protein